MKIVIVILLILSAVELISLKNLSERLDDVEKIVYHVTTAFPDKEDNHDSDN